MRASLDTCGCAPFYYLVGGGELGPGLVSAAVVVVGVSALHVLMEAQDLPGLQLRHRGPLGQLGWGHREACYKLCREQARVCVSVCLCFSYFV